MLEIGFISMGRMETSCLSWTGEEGSCVGTDDLVLMSRIHQKPCLWVTGEFYSRTQPEEAVLRMARKI